MNNTLPARAPAWIMAAALIFCPPSGCVDTPQAVIRTQLGVQLAATGEMTDTATLYSFKKYTRGGTVRDLFNYIYFAGDTLCFSVTLARNVTRDMARVHFENPHTGESFEAERLEVYGKRVFGFSLVGSVLERFYWKDLQNPVPAGMYCCENIPFIVRITIQDNGSRIESRIPGFFRIAYTP